MSPRPRLGLQGLSGTTVDQDFRIRLPRWKNFPSSRPFHVTFEMSILHSLMVATCRYTNKLTYWSTVIFLKLTFWSLNDLILKLNRPNVGLAGFMTYPKNYYYYLPQFYSFPSYESYGQNCQRIRKWPHWRRMRKIEMMKRILTRSFKRFWTQTHFFTECLNPWWKVSKNAPKYAQIVRASIILVIVYGIWDLKELFMHQDEFRPETIGWWIVMLIDILIDSMRGFFIASVYCFR